MLCRYAKSEWSALLGMVGLLATAALVMQWWIIAALIALIGLAGLALFRDPHRSCPVQRNVAVATCDGRIVAIDKLEKFAPLDDQPAVRIRVRIGLLDVHVNRCPCHAQVRQVLARHTKAKHDGDPSANGSSAPVDAQAPADMDSTLVILAHPTRGDAVAAVRQMACRLAGTIVTAVRESDILQRGQRFGMIKLGSMNELYLPESLSPELLVEQGQTVRAGMTIIARLHPKVSQTKRKAVASSSPPKHAESTSAATPTVEPTTPPASKDA